MWNNNENFQRIFLRFLPVLYTGGIFKIVKSRFTTSVTQGGYVNYQPVLHNTNLVENLCFVCWVGGGGVEEGWRKGDIQFLAYVADMTGRCRAYHASYKDCFLYIFEFPAEGFQEEGCGDPREEE